MKKFIATEIGSSLTPLLEKRKADIVAFANSLGFQTLSLPHFDAMRPEAEMIENEQPFYNDLINNVLTPINPGDMILQIYPITSGDEAEHVRYQAFIQALSQMATVGAVVLEYANYDHGRLDNVADGFIFFEKFDFLVVPNDASLKRLRALGLKQPIFNMELADFKVDYTPARPYFEKKLFVLDATEDLDEKTKWLDTEVEAISSSEAVTSKEEDSFWNSTLISKLDSGFGLALSESDIIRGDLQNPESLPAFMSAGLPVFVESRSPIAAFIEKNGLGFAVDNLAEIDNILNEMTPERYEELLENTLYAAQLVREGFFTKRVLTQLDALSFMDEGDDLPIYF